MCGCRSLLPASAMPDPASFIKQARASKADLLLLPSDNAEQVRVTHDRAMTSHDTHRQNLTRW